MKNPSISNHDSLRRASGGAGVLALACAGAVCASDPGYTEIKSYVVPVTTDYAVQPLLSVGDQVPNTADPTKVYQMIGIPDGLGAHKGPNDSTILYMNHELPNTTLSEPNVGGALNRGAIVSRWVLDRKGVVLSGKRAYDTVHDEENGTVLPPPEVGNTTPGFARLCSASLSWRESGFDRPIYFAAEESGGAATFDGKGGLAVAIFDNQLHTLVKLGRFPWENTVARPDPGDWTVVMCLEDGPATPDNQLYMYVGKKNKTPGASVLSRNGLDTGKLYTFICDTPGQTSELTFTSGSITGHWAELPDQTHVSDVDLETQSDALGAFTFIRIEDGAWSKTDRNTFYVVTTGSGAGNALGRLYEVKFDRFNILGTTKLNMIYNADAVAAANGDTAFAPDNVDTSREYLMICEDGTAQSRLEYAERAREGSIWRFDLRKGFTAKRIAELNPPGTAVASGQTAPPPVPTPGTWETSGIIDASSFFGYDTWLTVVQAHPPTLAPAPNTVEDGQLVLLMPTWLNLGGWDHDDD